MRLTVVAVCVVLLAGCATYGDLANRPADYTGKTSKAPDIFAQCALTAWVKIRPLARRVDDSDAVRIIVPVGGFSHHDVLLMLVVKPDSSGSTIAMKHSPSVGRFAAEWSAAESCM